MSIEHIQTSICTFKSEVANWRHCRYRYPLHLSQTESEAHARRGVGGSVQWRGWR